MSNRQVRATAIVIARRVLSVRRALRQPVHIVFRFESEDAVEKFLSDAPLPPALQVQRDILIESN